MNARIRDFFRTRQGWIFAVADYSHPRGLRSLLRYVPDPDGERQAGGRRYRKLDFETRYYAPLGSAGGSAAMGSGVQFVLGLTAKSGFIFGDGVDPVAEPGLPNGTPGNWWTVVAQSPELLSHCVSGFAFYRSEERELPKELRELAQLRAGWARQSRFVFSQHCKACRDNGVREAQIEAMQGFAVDT